MDPNQDQNPIYNLPTDVPPITEDQVRSIVWGMLFNYTTPTKVSSGYLQSQNFVSGVSGWQLSPTGAEINGGVSVASLDIPNTTTANSFHVDTNGNAWWGANVASGYANANAYILATGAAVFKNVQIGGTTIQYVVTNSGIFSYGDSNDGTGTFDGSATPAGSSKSGSDYTLTRDVYYSNMTVSDGVTVNPAGYRIYVQQTLTVGGGTSGKIFRNGNNGGNGANGTQGADGSTTGGASTLADGYLKGSPAGGTGGFCGATGGSPSGAHSGGSGVATTNSLGTDSVGAAGSGGGGVDSIGGGHGGAGGGSAATATIANVRLTVGAQLAWLLDVGSSGTTVKYNNSAGAPGGGSGGYGQPSNGSSYSSGGSGGGGAGPGGMMAIYAKVIIINAGGIIQVLGGVGGTGGNGVDANGVFGGGSGGGGGGTGGNGGIIIMAYNQLTNNGSISAAAGAGGTGGVGGLGFSGNGRNGGAGTSGSTGSAGTIYQFQLSL